MKLYVGWDVGGWNCDRNPDSRDALCALTDSGEQPVVVGTPWRGNVRPALCGTEVVADLLALLDCDASDATEIVVAIDTPLAWPSPALQLLREGITVRVPSEAAMNPYLFRRVEMLLSDLGKQPLSPIRDMIGSQSLKGMHFLRAAALQRSRIGVWQRTLRGRRTVAIECYPAACKQSVSMQKMLKAIDAPIQNGDARDAACAAVIAWMFSNQREALINPVAKAPRDEGWIWVPRDAFPA